MMIKTARKGSEKPVREGRDWLVLGLTVVVLGLVAALLLGGCCRVPIHNPF